MDRGLAVLLTAAVGGLIALQPPINAGLGRATGNLAGRSGLVCGRDPAARPDRRADRAGGRALLDLRRALVLPASAACSAPPT